METGDVQLTSSEGIRGAVRGRAVDGRSWAFLQHEAVSALLQGGAGYDALDALRWWLGIVRPPRVFPPRSLRLTQCP